MSAISSLQLVELTIQTLNDSGEHRASLMRCYSRVFAGHPWHERMACFGCPKLDGRDIQYPFFLPGTPRGAEPYRDMPADGTCVFCGKSLSPFWDEARITESLASDLSKPGGVGFMAIQSGEVVGFTVAYICEPDELEGRLELPGLAKTIKEACDQRGIPHSGAYLSEIGVDETRRGQGIGKLLFKERMRCLLPHNPGYLIFRTRPDSDTHAWYTRAFGFTVMDSYTRLREDDKRVILFGGVPSSNA